MAELNDIGKQFSKTHLSLTNEIRHNGNPIWALALCVITNFAFKNLKTKNSISYKRLKSQKKLRDDLKHLTFHICIFNPNP